MIGLKSPEEQKFWRMVFADGYEGLVLWVNLCAWLYEARDKTNPASGVRMLPFITWPIQDKFLKKIYDSITDEHDMLTDKSRDMGATYGILIVLLWFWLFSSDFSALIASRKEDLVDKAGSPDCLFWKIDRIMVNLPPWMKPRIRRNFAHLENLDNGSVIDGESTNEDLGRGGRRRVIMLDEFAAVTNGDEILSATADTTGCRLFNSTPKGRGNAFATVRFSGKVEVFTLPWWEHPVKARGRRQITLADGSKRWTSPWYEGEVARRTSRKEVAQELDIDYLASGDAFFDLEVLQQIRGGDTLRTPDHRGEVGFKVDSVGEAEFYLISNVQYRETKRGRLHLWIELDENGRPPQNRNYVAFSDISNGQGASNSIISFEDVHTREVVAEWVCPDTSPSDFARVSVALCRWFGGGDDPLRSRVLLGWEANGPGGIYGREIYRLGYARVLGNKDLTIPWYEEKRKSIGWHSSKDNKRLLLEDYRRCLARGEMIEHQIRVITEAELYIHYPSGSIGPSELIENPEGARAEHGDFVISRAGLLICMREQPKAEPRPPDRPQMSFEGRHQASDNKQGYWE